MMSTGINRFYTHTHTHNRAKDDTVNLQWGLGRFCSRAPKKKSGHCSSDLDLSCDDDA